MHNHISNQQIKATKVGIVVTSRKERIMAREAMTGLVRERESNISFLGHFAIIY